MRKRPEKFSLAGMMPSWAKTMVFIYDFTQTPQTTELTMDVAEIIAIWFKKVIMPDFNDRQTLPQGLNASAPQLVFIFCDRWVEATFRMTNTLVTEYPSAGVIAVFVQKVKVQVGDVRRAGVKSAFIFDGDYETVLTSIDQVLSGNEFYSGFQDRIGNAG